MQSHLLYLYRVHSLSGRLLLQFLTHQDFIWHNVSTYIEDAHIVGILIFINFYHIYRYAHLDLDNFSCSHTYYIYIEYIVCPDDSSYSFWHSKISFGTMFIRILEMRILSGFGFLFIFTTFTLIWTFDILSNFTIFMHIRTYTIIHAVTALLNAGASFVSYRHK